MLFAGFQTFRLAAQIPGVPEDVSPLLIGEKVPDIELTDMNGKQESITELAKQKPTILVMYRGGWCPFCNRHLSDLASVQTEIMDMGYQIVAVSPDIPEKLTETSERNGFEGLQLSDPDAKLIKAMGLAYKAPETNMTRLLEYSGGKNSDILPVPSLFVLDSNGAIRFEYINPNYRIRIGGKFLVNVLKALDEND